MTHQTVAIDSRVQSQVILICQWDLEEDNYNFSVRYYGTARSPRCEQLAECLDRASTVANPHIGIRLKDGNWITGAVSA